MIGVPVRCPNCNQRKLIIRPGDKYFCLTPHCSYARRLPTDLESPVNKSMQRYYIKELEVFACEMLGLDYLDLRRDGTITYTETVTK